MTFPSPAVPAGPVDDLGRRGTAENGEPSLTVSAEQLHVSTEPAAAGSVRLEKYLITETRTLQVEVTCERVRLIFTGPDGTQNVVENPPATFHASPLAVDSSRWLFLHEEQPVVTKQWVPVERIRLDKYQIAGEQAVTEPVRAEHVELTTDPAVTSQERTPGHEH